MHNRTIASLGCKFLGIYALIKSISLFGQIFQMYSFAKDDSSFGIALIISTSIPSILMLAVAIVLIIGSNRFAEKMVDTKNNQSINQNISTLDLQTIAFSVVGLVLLLMSFPKMMQICWNVYVIKSAGDNRNIAEIISKTWSFALATGVQFIIGFILFIGSELFSSLWHKAVKRLRYERNIT